MVGKPSVNHPSIDGYTPYRDKYHKYENITILSLLSEFCLFKECQLCCRFFLPKIWSLSNSFSYQPALVFLPKNKKYSASLATHQENIKIEKDNYPLYLSIFARNQPKLISSLVSNLTLKNHIESKYSNLWRAIVNKLRQCNDIELNPGPTKVKVKIITYNVRGMKEAVKLKRILNTCHNLITRDRYTVICLQETHLEEVDKQRLGFLWKHKFVLSPGTPHQCGTLILFSPSWEESFAEVDDEGRVCWVGLEALGRSFCFTNLYAPNNHDVTFFAKVYEKLITIQTDHPESKLIMVGDFNLVTSDNDSVNRKSSQVEVVARNYIARKNKLLEMIDTYRQMHRLGGFTWSRGNCMSRLDMIYVQSDLANSISSASVNWAFDNSDHAMLEAVLTIQIEQSRGPGLIRLNVDLLEDEQCKTEIEKRLTEQLSQIPLEWDPHKKLDFTKVALRSIFMEVSNIKKRLDISDLNATEKQLNLLKTHKECTLNSIPLNERLLRDLDIDITHLETKLNSLLEAKGKYLINRAKAKWAEQGERSNKYFLNIINQRKEQTTIKSLATPTGTVTSQDEIMSHVKTFYETLYDDKTPDDNYDDFFSDVPKLNDEDNAWLDRDIGLDELLKTVRGCSESSPGPDGITYKVYQDLWNQLGPILLDAWKYSVSQKLLPEDQRISAITLLPKLGKNHEQIENWRPITLTNCDLKIFTKLISNRVAKKLDKLIHPSQTAYVPGRTVHDNLRMFEFYNSYCKKHNVDALLVSLDAKKAFDSVNHKYLAKTLSAYGFSSDFIELVKLLYRDIKATILVNGYKSAFIKILRSVKQGDALSCALFILCIDPLIRKIENNPLIKPVPIKPSRFSNVKITNKVGTFADDVGMAVKNDEQTVNEIFKTYNKFSALSGIELNVDKTEFLKLNNDTTHSDFTPSQIVTAERTFDTVESIKICGITFSNNSLHAYDENVIDKIEKLEKQLIRWLSRGLSVEGKILIVKTFGLSQMIYSLQMCDITDRDIANTERIIFKFLWNRKWIGNPAPDRIKRSTLKLDYENGGLNVPDIGILNQALKTKQFIRASMSNHPIKLIQTWCMEETGYPEEYKIEYRNFCNIDPVIKSYQRTVTKITDSVRSKHSTNDSNNSVVASLIASTDVFEYLSRKKFLLVRQCFMRLAMAGIETFHDLNNENRFPRSDAFGNIARDVLNFLPRGWEQSVNTSEEVNNEIKYDSLFVAPNLKLIHRRNITVKSIRKVLMESMDIPAHAYRVKLGLNLDNLGSHNPYTHVRQFNKAPRDRFFKFRILHGDVFCNTRRFKFKMIDSPCCEFCGELEDIKHLIWSCERSKICWEYFNQLTGTYYNRQYVTYESIVVGSENPEYLLEELVTLILRVIMTKERNNRIEREKIQELIKNKYYLDKLTCNNSRKIIWLDKKWAKMSNFVNH